MIRYSPNISVMFDASRKASKHILRDFGELEHLQVSVKGQNDFVTNVDLKVQEIIHRELSKARPGFGFIMEDVVILRFSKIPNMTLSIIRNR